MIIKPTVSDRFYLPKQDTYIFIYTYIYIYIYDKEATGRISADAKEQGLGGGEQPCDAYLHHPISGGSWLDLGINQAEKSSPPATRREHVVAHEVRRGSLL